MLLYPLNGFLNAPSGIKWFPAGSFARSASVA